jgi:hypothetical protein
MFTSGMSDRPQNVPPEREDCRFSELVIFLPPDWPGGRGDDVVIEDARLTWVKQWLLYLARYPHATGNWVGPGHLFPTGDAEPLPGTGFSAFVLLEPISLPWEIAGRVGERSHSTRSCRCIQRRSSSNAVRARPSFWIGSQRIL